MSFSELIEFFAAIGVMAAGFSVWHAALQNGRAMQMLLGNMQQQTSVVSKNNAPFLLIDGDREFQFFYRGHAPQAIFQDWDSDSEAEENAQSSSAQFFLRFCNVGRSTARQIAIRMVVENTERAIECIRSSKVDFPYHLLTDTEGDSKNLFLEIGSNRPISRKIPLSGQRVQSMLFLTGGGFRFIQAPEQFVVLYNLLICSGISLETSELPILKIVVTAQSISGIPLIFHSRVVPVHAHALLASGGSTAARCKFRTLIDDAKSD